MPYTSKCDIWALGLIFYQLIFKTLPWYGNSEYELISCIQNKPLIFPHNVSPTTEHFLRGCLGLFENDRFSWQQLLKHDIFKGQFANFFTKDALMENNLKTVLNRVKFNMVKQNLSV